MLDEVFNFSFQLNAFLRVMTMISMELIVLVLVAIGRQFHWERPSQILFLFYLYENFCPMGKQRDEATRLVKVLGFWAMTVGHAKLSRGSPSRFFSGLFLLRFFLGLPLSECSFIYVNVLLGMD